jgi:hypothetical protein
MVQPVNYMAAMPQIDLSQSFAGLGKALGEYGDYREQQKKDQAAADLKMQYADDVKAYFAKPSASGLSMLTAKYPGQREAFKDIGDRMSAEQKTVELPVMAQAFHAITTGKPDAAKLLVDQQIEGMQNSGMDATKLKMIRSQLDSDPTQVAGLIGLVGSSIDPDGWGKMMGEKRAQDLQPDLVRKGAAEAGAAESDATIKAANAKYAESEAVLDLEKKGWDIKKIKEDIDINKQNARIAAMNASLAREGNALKRQELQMKMDDAIASRDEKVRGKVAEATTAINAVNSTAGVFNDILSDEDTLRAAVGTSAWRGSIPGTKTRSMAGKIEQLQNMMTAENLGLLKGAMSDKDVAFLRNISTNLDRYQDEDSFLSEMKRVGKNLAKAQNQIAKKYGAPIESFDLPSSEAPSSSEVDALLKKYGGG